MPVAFLDAPLGGLLLPAIAFAIWLARQRHLEGRDRWRRELERRARLATPEGQAQSAQAAKDRADHEARWEHNATLSQPWRERWSEMTEDERRAWKESGGTSA